jgi:hypothetical protein
MAIENKSSSSPHPAWHSEDADNLRKFLRTPTGAKFLGMLAQLRPVFTATTVEAAALEGKVIDGWERCVELILSAGLMKPKNDTIEPVEYPDLDSEDGWDPALQMTPNPEPEVLTTTDSAIERK